MALNNPPSIDMVRDRRLEARTDANSDEVKVQEERILPGENRFRAEATLKRRLSLAALSALRWTVPLLDSWDTCPRFPIFTSRHCFNLSAHCLRTGTPVYRQE